VLDIDDARLLPPGDMPGRLAELARTRGEPVPMTPPEVVRCILDNLALAHRRRLHAAMELADHDVSTIHIVGGGSQNPLLCQLTADACGLPVLAGPAEASTIGNALIQSRALGVDLPDLPAMRALVGRGFALQRYDPRPGAAADWAAAARRC
jgi:rhamnulokinase